MNTESMTDKVNALIDAGFNANYDDEDAIEYGACLQFSKNGIYDSLNYNVVNSLSAEKLVACCERTIAMRKQPLELTGEFEGDDEF